MDTSLVLPWIAIGISLGGLGTAVAGLQYNRNGTRSSASSAAAAQRSADAAQVSAGAAQRSADAAEVTASIDRERRLEERRPRLTATFEALYGGHQYRLRITLDTEEPLAGLDVTIAEWHGIEFNPRTVGVVMPPPGDRALQAFCWDPHTNEPAGLRPHKSVTWAADVGAKPPAQLQLDVTCHGATGEQWDLVVSADVQPRTMDTIG